MHSASQLLTEEIRDVLAAHSMNAEAHIEVLGGATLVALVREIASPVSVHSDLESLLRSVRAHPLSVVIADTTFANEILNIVNTEHLNVGVLVYVPEDDRVLTTSLRSRGAMACFRQGGIELRALARRGLDYRALYLLELAHRCEAKRLSNRELVLIGEPPEGMSDDLNSCQPPPLPVGPLSVYNLEEATDDFERAYIDRALRLCASSREAAAHLSVSSATLSRRLRREIPLEN